MADPESPSFPAHGPVSASRLNQRSQALLRECFGQFVGRLHKAVHISVHATNDLFDFNEHVSMREVADFRVRRDQWLLEYERTLRMLYVRRIGGTPRSGRRPDPESAPPTFHLLDPLDQEMQVALIRKVKDLQLATSVELVALSHRVAVLLGAKWRPDFDNPFDPQYVLDAIGSAARATYVAPLIWRALMQRVVVDITPILVKIYIAQNRFLADQNVLPQIKAELRTRSPHRPAEDSDLLHAFGRLMVAARAASAPTPPVVVTPLRVVAQSTPPTGSPSSAFAPARPARIRATQAAGHATETPPVRLPDDVLLQALSEVARIPPPGRGRPATTVGAPHDALPSLDPEMALGATRSLVDALSKLQRVDLPQAIVRAAQAFDGHWHDAALVPSNLIPYLRAVLAGAITHEKDAMVMDFVSLLFDYAFRDPSIPESLHGVFERLQVPIVKIALIDYEFFTRSDHPARKLLDSLAEASIGAAADTAYFREFEAVATDVVNAVCRYPHLDVSVFVDAAAAVKQFIEDDYHRTASELAPDVADALATEQHDLGRAQAQAMVRDHLAGLSVPVPVRTFVESVWVDYLTLLQQRTVDGSGAHKKACATLDDLLWSLTAKERHSERRRLAAMIPTLVAALRQGCVVLGLPHERTSAFFDELFSLHISVLKRTDDAISRAASAATEATLGRVAADTERVGRLTANKGIYDFVGEMIVGSWIAFMAGQREMVSRLWWVSPMRTRYVFTDRTRAHGWVLTPEQLAHQLEVGTASVVVEPIPLFDRAVSAAFDAVGAGIPVRTGAAA